MPPVELTQVESLFLKLVAAPREQRQASLAMLNLAPELKADLEDLLRADDEAESSAWLRSPLESPTGKSLFESPNEPPNEPLNGPPSERSAETATPPADNSTNKSHESTRLVDELFLQLCGKPLPIAESTLDEVCDNAAVRARVLELLQADQQASVSHWLEHSPLEDALEVDLSLTETRDHSDTDLRGEREAERVAPGPACVVSDLTATEEAPGLPRVPGYQIRHLLGEGAFAGVYLAYDERRGHDVALKISHRPLSSERQRARFRNEFQVQANPKLHGHPNIVSVYHADLTDCGRAFISMEHVAGQNLREYLRSEGTLPLERVREIMAPVCEAMAVAHAARVVHRDLKPENILIDKNGAPRISDFGLAIRDDHANSAGEFAGTTAYMSPEQIRRESDNLYGSADIWALGVIGYELLTGQRPFLGKRQKLREAILRKDPKKPRELRDEIPRKLEAVCLSCLSKDPRERPSSARDLASAFADGPRRIPRRTAAIGALSLCGGGALALLGWGVIGPRWDSLPTSQPPAETTAIEGDWTSQLDRSPEVVSTNYREIVVTQLPEKRHIIVDSKADALIKVSHTDLGSFGLRLVVQKTIWQGEFGLMWGFQEVVVEGRKCRTANLIRFRCRDDEEAGKQVVMTCHRWLFTPIGEGRYERQELLHGVPEQIHPKWLRKASAGQIELMVAEDGSIELSWQRRRVVFETQPEFGDHRGGFGFLNADGAVVVGVLDFFKPAS